jgi:hypothetical protein
MINREKGNNRMREVSDRDKMNEQGKMRREVR